MSTADLTNSAPDNSYEQLLRFSMRGFEAAREAAEALAKGAGSPTSALAERVRQYEEELDKLDHDINDGVTAAISQEPAQRTRELLACLKFIIELERIGDLLLNVANRAVAVGPRLEAQAVKDLSTMAGILARMLGQAQEAFEQRDVKKAVDVLKADAEMDRLRNLVFVRHIENPEHQLHTESFHVVFMIQSLERAGDHAKNVAEEVVHLVSGRSVRHVLRQYDKPDEVVFVERMRRQAGKK
ncbi:MAG TPA: PhoU domain-containing protein [Terriglobales bacterium]|jgi:phosphate transport system protein|nr:PhoU domain-containing protein [Terriglobales bacterium]